MTVNEIKITSKYLKEVASLTELFISNLAELEESRSDIKAVKDLLVTKKEVRKITSDVAKGVRKSLGSAIKSKFTGEEGKIAHQHNLIKMGEIVFKLQSKYISMEDMVSQLPEGLETDVAIKAFKDGRHKTLLSVAKAKAGM